MSSWLRQWKTKLAIAALVTLSAIGLLAYVCSKSTALDTRWNYHRAGPFAISTPSISHDGLTVVFDTAVSGNGDIYLARRGNPQAERLTASPDVEMRPTLAPNGHTIAYARQNGGYQHVWTMDTSGSNQVQMTFGRVIDEPIAYSPDGETLHFMRSTFAGRALLPRRELWEIMTRSGKAAPLSTIDSVRAIAADGRKILLEVYGSAEHANEIHVLSPAEGKENLIAHGSSPEFSPTGDKIAFLNNATNYQPDIMLCKSDGGRLEVLPSPKGYKTEPKFCFDGTAVIYRIPQSERDGPGGAFLTFLSDGRIQRIDQVTGE
jgi:Tol biopolymer transport system component